MSKPKRRRRPSRVRRRNSLPKGADRLPIGDDVVTGSWGPPDKRGRRIRVRAIHRAEPDAAKVAQALIALAIELAQADSQTILDRTPVR